MAVKTSYIGSFYFNIYFIRIGMERKDPELNGTIWLSRHLTWSSFLRQCNWFVYVSPYHTFKEEIIPTGIHLCRYKHNQTAENKLVC